MLQTQEEIKKAVRDYLAELPSKTKHVEEYTLSRISQVIKADISKVEEAIESLIEEKILDSRKIHLEVFVPKNKEGFGLITVFAKEKLIKYSPYWAIAFGFALLYIGFRAGGNHLSLPADIQTLSEAYLKGVEYGIGYSFLVGLVGGIVIENLLSKFRCWQIVSEEVYATISNLFKNIVYIFGALGIGYYLIANQIGYPLEPGVFAALLGIAVAVAFGYVQITKDKRGGRILVRGN